MLFHLLQFYTFWHLKNQRSSDILLLSEEVLFCFEHYIHHRIVGYDELPLLPLDVSVGTLIFGYSFTFSWKDIYLARIQVVSLFFYLLTNDINISLIYSLYIESLITLESEKFVDHIIVREFYSISNVNRVVSTFLFSRHERNSSFT